MKSGNLNFLEPSGPLQAGNGADCFTFLYTYVNIILILNTQYTSQNEKLYPALKYNRICVDFIVGKQERCIQGFGEET
jgi:hypothetical protein